MILVDKYYAESAGWMILVDKYHDSRRHCKTQAHVYHLSVQRVTDLTSNRVDLNKAISL